MNPLVYPMAAQVFLTFLVALYMLYVRISAVQQRQIKISYFQTFSLENPPDAVLRTNRHFSNLFELPVLFFATVLLTMVLDLPYENILLLAWIFVIARLVHALVHIFSKRLYPRMAAYMISWLAVLAMWILILV